MSDLEKRVAAALCDPKAPWYGSDLVADVGDLIESNADLRQQLKRRRFNLVSRSPKFSRRFRQPSHS